MAKTSVTKISWTGPSVMRRQGVGDGEGHGRDGWASGLADGDARPPGAPLGEARDLERREGRPPGQSRRPRPGTRGAPRGCVGSHRRRGSRGPHPRTRGRRAGCRWPRAPRRSPRRGWAARRDPRAPGGRAPGTRSHRGDGSGSARGIARLPPGTARRGGPWSATRTCGRRGPGPRGHRSRTG